LTVAPAPPLLVEDAELRAKLIERRDTLKKLGEILMIHQDNGTSIPSLVAQAQIDLLEAELPLAKTHAERIVLYERSLEAWTKIEKVTQTMLEVGVGSPNEYLRAKADRIKAEIDLHNARKVK